MEHPVLSHEPFAKSEIGINLFCKLRWFHQASLVGSVVDGRWLGTASVIRRTGGLERSKVIEMEVIMIW